MTDRVTVQVLGLKEVEDKLLTLMSFQTRRKVVREALHEGARPLVIDIRRRAPVRTGDLVETVAASGRLSRSQQGKADKRSDLEVYVGTGSNPQAVQQEFGNENHPPQPFMRPAWDANKREVLDRIAAALFIGIEEALGRQAKRRARAPTE